MVALTKEKQKIKDIGVAIFCLVLFAGCMFVDKDFVVIRFEEHNFTLFLKNTKANEVTFQGQINSEFDGTKVYEITGNGEILINKHKIVIKENELTVDGNKIIDMNVKPPYSMIFSKDGSLKEGFLRDFI